MYDSRAYIKILELMAIDLTGLLAELKTSDPMYDVVKQRMEAIEAAQKAMTHLSECRLALRAAIHKLEDRFPGEEIYKCWTNPPGIEESILFDDAAKYLRKMLEGYHG